MNTLEKLHSRKETAIAFHISIPTIDRYRKKGLLKAIKIGGKVLFRESEILRVLEEAS